MSAAPVLTFPDGFPSRARRESRTVLAEIVAIFAIRIALAATVHLGDDEAYYASWARHVDWSYFDHPGMVAWTIRVAMLFLGRTEIAVRLPALAFSAGTSAGLFVLARDLFPERPRVAWLALLLANLAPVMSIGAVFAAPDAPFAFFWVSSLVLARRAMRDPRLWYAAGAAAGLGLLSKYNMVLLVPALAIWLAATGELRHALSRKEPWLGAAIAALLFLPVLIWNAQHGWASFAFHLHGRHHGRFMPFTHLAQFTGAQLGLVSPVLLAVTVLALVRGARGAERDRFLAAVSGFVILFFAVLCPFGDFKPHWPAAGWLTGLIAAADLLDRGAPRLRRWTIGVAAAMSALLYAVAVVPVGAWIPSLPPKADLTNELHGWPEAMDHARPILAAMPPGSFVFSHMYQNAAQAEFYGDRSWTVTRLGARHDEYEIVRDDASLAGHDGLYIARDPYALDPTGKFPFASCEPAGTMPFSRAGRVVRTFSYWRCRDYRP